MRHTPRLLCAVVVSGLVAGGLLGGTATTSASPASVYRTLDWESAADRALPVTGWDFIKQSKTAHGVNITSATTRDGSHAVRFDLRRGDPLANSGTRAELSQRDDQPALAERWYGFSLNLDPSWTQDASAEIVSQWHDCDDVRCGGGSPPLALLTDEGRWKVDFQGDIIDLGPYATGRWTDWVFHVKWRSDSTGVVQVWRDGQEVLSETGRTYDGGPRSPYFKFGIYKWDWGQGKPSSTTQRVMTYDALRLGNETATRADVDPSQGGPAACSAPRAAVSASATTSEAANPPSHVLDGRLDTRWSGQGFGAALVLDLGATHLVCGTKVAWHRGDQRWNDYTVYTSTDNVTYTKAWEGRSKGTSVAGETETFSPRGARYVKISFWQNPENDWASITEASVVSDSP